MLIRRAEVWRRGIADVRLADGRIAAIGDLPPRPGEPMFDARGGALLPGLHDHHIHLFALAARASSIACGPAAVATRDQLADALAAAPGEGWIRGVGYHESVLGLPDARVLDMLVRERPLRIQHRSGRMWLINSAGLDQLLAAAPPPPGLQREDGRFTGRLFDEDNWLRAALGGTAPDLAATSARLARCGVTGVTDMSPRNDPATAALFEHQIASDALVQHLTIAGAPSLASAKPGHWRLGAVKLHLHEAALPDFADASACIAAAHANNRPVAVHCVSEIELVFALALFESAGALAGDRIEHASVASSDLVERMAALGMWVCVQPHFVFERGDRYLLDVDRRHQRDLYRLRTLLDAGLALAGGSDAPFGEPDPWTAMRAAVARRTRAGAALGGGEALDPEPALALFLKAPDDLTRERAVAPGEPADLCLLDRPWSAARDRLRADDVRACWVSGGIVHDRVDQSPVQRLARREAAA